MFSKRAFFLAIALQAGIISHSTLMQEVRAQDAELVAVKKGVFTVKEGQSIDLTADRGLLLHLRRINAASNGRITADFTINGSGGSYSIGVRRNLKAESQTTDFIKDLRICFLDLVSAKAPVGTIPSATFRLLCE